MTARTRPAWHTPVAAALDSTRSVYLACACSLALGLFFVFVWSPLPFGWLGIDHYDDRALQLAAGEPFDTTDVPWGYAYYLAFFYAIFGHHPWIPLVGQVLLNAFVPLLLYALVLPLADRRIAIASAMLVGVFSFNTIYASTQSSDAVCTVLVLASLVLFDRGRRAGGIAAFAASGLVAGLAPQFRPNMILLPPVLAAVMLADGVDGRKLRSAGVYLALAGLALAPWTIRNYRLTGEFLPTSSHGGYQLWLGTLESGAYVERRPDNPRKVFDSPAFDYTSLDRRTIEIAALAGDCDPHPTLVYWTDRAPTPERITARQSGSGIGYSVPGQPSPTTLYYYFESSGPDRNSAPPLFTPRRGADDPLVFFVSTDHLGDLDRHHDVADIFDIIRLLRHEAWNEPLPDGQIWDLTGDGRIDRRDSERLIERLIRTVGPTGGEPQLREIVTDAHRILIRLADGSTVEIPHVFDARITDLEARGDLASKLIYARLPMPELLEQPQAQPAPCVGVHDVTVNDVFYRREPHWMRRYTALAFDNIRREPVAFLAASLYRIGRLFIIRGSTDPSTAHQFAASRLIYRVGLVISVAVLLLFLTGVWIAWRRRAPLLWLLIPILYVPLTICFVLTNMRYSITVQPYVFAFIAVVLVDRVRLAASRA